MGRGYHGDSRDLHDHTADAHRLIAGAVQLLRGSDGEQVYHQLRRRLGSGILLGIEFLVAADIIHTVAVELTFRTLGTLAIIVVIRTFLSFTLEVELSGCWPWQKNNDRGAESG